MIKEKRYVISIFVVVIIIAAGISVAVPAVLESLEKEPKVITPPILVKIFADRNEGAFPLMINFTSMPLYYVGDLKYFWDFGDGNTSDEMNPTYIYETNGTFICNLTITDSNDQSASDSVEITASGNQEPKPTIIFKPTYYRPFHWFLYKLLREEDNEARLLRSLVRLNILPKSFMIRESFVDFDSQVYDPEGDKIVKYEWELRANIYSSMSGKQFEPIYSQSGANASSWTVPFVYTIPHKCNYRVTLKVTDSNGKVGTVTEPFQVKKGDLEAFISEMIQRSDRFRRETWIAQKWGDQARGGLIPLYETILDMVDNLPPVLRIIIKGWIINKAADWIIIEGADKITEIINRIVIPILDNSTFLTNIIKFGLNAAEKSFNKLYNITGWDLFNLSDFFEKSRELLGFSNKRPIIQEETAIPAHQSENLPVALCEYVSIFIDDLHLDSAKNDTENNTFDIRIYGDYIENGEQNWSDAKTGRFTANLTALPENCKIKWFVEVVDFEGDVVEEAFWFKTFR